MIYAGRAEHEGKSRESPWTKGSAARLCALTYGRGAGIVVGIEVWGDGTCTRRFMYIDDCLKGIQTITESEILEPINLGGSELVTINQLMDVVKDIAGVSETEL